MRATSCVRKNLDLIAANEVSEGQVFDSDDNALLVLWPSGRRELQQKNKCELAHEFVALVAERYLEACTAPILKPVAGG